MASSSASTRAPAAKLKRRVLMTLVHFLDLTSALAGWHLTPFSLQ
jgi:hypothetical protein